MDNLERINNLKKLIEEEGGKDNPNQKELEKMVRQIALLGIGLDMNPFAQKPFTNV